MLNGRSYPVCDFHNYFPSFWSLYKCFFKNLGLIGQDTKRPNILHTIYNYKIIISTQLRVPAWKTFRKRSYCRKLRGCRIYLMFLCFMKWWLKNRYAAFIWNKRHFWYFKTVWLSNYFIKANKLKHIIFSTSSKVAR